MSQGAPRRPAGTTRPGCRAPGPRLDARSRPSGRPSLAQERDRLAKGWHSLSAPGIFQGMKTTALSLFVLAAIAFAGPQCHKNGAAKGSDSTAVVQCPKSKDCDKMDKKDCAKQCKKKGGPECPKDSTLADSTKI